VTSTGKGGEREGSRGEGKKKDQSRRTELGEKEKKESGKCGRTALTLAGKRRRGRTLEEKGMVQDGKKSEKKKSPGGDVEMEQAWS